MYGYLDIAGNYMADDMAHKGETNDRIDTDFNVLGELPDQILAGNSAQTILVWNHGV